jgi:hypothetical protein
VTFQEINTKQKLLFKSHRILRRLVCDLLILIAFQSIFKFFPNSNLAYSSFLALLMLVAILFVPIAIIIIFLSIIFQLKQVKQKAASGQHLSLEEEKLLQEYQLKSFS